LNPDTAGEPTVSLTLTKKQLGAIIRLVHRTAQMDVATDMCNSERSSPESQESRALLQALLRGYKGFETPPRPPVEPTGLPAPQKRLSEETQTL
jgi:hypothetical protein